MNTAHYQHNCSPRNFHPQYDYDFHTCITPPEDDTIISFESPYQLKDLGISKPRKVETESEQLINQHIFNIRLVNSDKKREHASLLIKKKYSWRGYTIENNINTEPNRITLVAETEGEIVGTLTLCLDTETKLPADDNFGDILQKFRSQKRKISEPSRLAIDDNSPKRVLAALLHIAYIYARNIHQCTDWVAEVNPRHVNFYKRMLDFKVLGEKRTCSRVNAPAILLKLDLMHMGQQISKFGGLMGQYRKEKTYYPYFFSYNDEIGITNRLLTAERTVTTSLEKAVNLI